MEEKICSIKLQIRIDGMSCQSCERRINATLTKLAGVIQSNISFQKGTADVEFDRRLTTENDVFLAITKLGYKISGDSQNSSSCPASDESQPRIEAQIAPEQNRITESSEKVTIPITGMHCKSCEMRIEDQFMTQKGVIKASADFRNGILSLICEKGYSLKDEQIAKLLEAIGYTVGQGSTKFALFSKNPGDYQDCGIALVILLGLYAIIRGLGLGDLAPSTSSKSFSLPIISLIGLTAGFSTCMALVGGLVLGISARMSDSHPNATPGEKFRPHLFFCSGRIISYFLLGGILGLVGSIFQFSSFSLGVLTIVIGIVMLIMGIQLLDIFPWTNRLRITLPKSISRKFGSPSAKKYSHGNTMLLGALTFFLPCGFTQAMQVYAIGTGNFFDGALTMGAFVIGTIPGLLGIGGLTSIVKGAFARRFFKLAGLVVICFAVFNISNGLGLSGFSLPLSNQSSASLNDPNVTIENGVQIVRMKEVEKGYIPKTFSIRSDMPVRWIIDAGAPMSCAASFVVPKFNIRKTLMAGENIIDFPSQAPGVIKFSCSMGMYRGSFSVLDPKGENSVLVTKENVESENGLEESQSEYSIARISDSLQYVESNVTESGYQPIIVQKGIPVEWKIITDSTVLNACNSRIKIPDLKIQQELKAGQTTIRFTAPNSGEIEFTCWMNMIKSTILVVDTLDSIKYDSLRTNSNKISFAADEMPGCSRHTKRSCCRN